MCEKRQKSRLSRSARLLYGERIFWRDKILFGKIWVTIGQRRAENVFAGKAAGKSRNLADGKGKNYAGSIAMERNLSTTKTLRRFSLTATHRFSTAKLRRKDITKDLILRQFYLGRMSRAARMSWIGGIAAGFSETNWLIISYAEMCTLVNVICLNLKIEYIIRI